MPFRFWKKKTDSAPAQNYRLIEESNTSSSSNSQPQQDNNLDIPGLSEKKKAQLEEATASTSGDLKRRQRIEQPPPYEQPGPKPNWPWSSHNLVLGSPETIPKPGVKPSIAPSPSPFPRYGHSLTPTATDEGDLILFGGLVGDTLTNDVYAISIRDGTTKLIETGGDIPSPRLGHACTLVGKHLLIWGGDTRDPNSPGKDDLDSSLFALDLVQRQWRCVPITREAPQSRYGHGLCAVGNTLYLFGGQTDSAFWNDAWTIDVSSLNSKQSDSSGSKDALTWVQIHIPSTNIPAKRTNHTWIPYGRNIYLFGGTDGEYRYHDTWAFGVESRRWLEVDALGYIPTPREGHAAAIVDDIMYIFGGRGVDHRDIGELGAFRIQQKRWFRFRNMGPEPSPRSGHAMASVNNVVFVLGGLGSNDTAFRDQSVVHVLETGNLKYPALLASPTKMGSGHAE